MDNLFYCNSQGRDQRICLWDLAEGRTSVTDSVFTEHVGFCRCSLVQVAQGRWLMAMAARSLEEVGSVSFSVLERLLLVLKWHGSEGETPVPLNSLLRSRQHNKPLGVWSLILLPQGWLNYVTHALITRIHPKICLAFKYLQLLLIFTCRSFEKPSGAAEYWEQESYWGTNGQQVCPRMEELTLHLKLSRVWREEGRCRWFVMQYVLFHPRLIPYLELGLEIVELLWLARGLLCVR